MILTKDKLADKSDLHTKAEKPPPYSTNAEVSTSNRTTSTSTSSSVRALPPKTNYLHIERSHTSLKDTYVIDPSMMIPESVLAPLEKNEVRKNVFLKCTHGSINADVWLVSNVPQPNKASIEGHVQHGYLNLTLHVDSDQFYDLKLSSAHGSITLVIPTSFQGLLTINSAHSWVKYSDALTPRMRTFSDVKGVRKCFVGDFGDSDFGEGEWQGSSIEIYSRHGGVKLRYVDEVQDLKANIGFFAKLFRSLA